MCAGAHGHRGKTEPRESAVSLLGAQKVSPMEAGLLGAMEAAEESAAASEKGGLFLWGRGGPRNAWGALPESGRTPQRIAGDCIA